MQNVNLTVGSKSYDRFQETPDKTTYISDAHTVGDVDLLLLGRTVPTSTTGSAKVRVNLVQDCMSGTGADKVNVGRAYANAEMSVPVQATDVDRAALLSDFRAYIASESFAELYNKQSI